MSHKKAQEIRMDGRHAVKAHNDECGGRSATETEGGYESTKVTRHRERHRNERVRYQDWEIINMEEDEERPRASPSAAASETEVMRWHHSLRTQTSKSRTHEERSELVKTSPVFQEP